ncbi:MAG: hypothetical protein AB7O38_30565 [Pirellulaceae bacterium]
MDYEIRRQADELDSTDYVEIGPGRYNGQHWQKGFIFIWEGAFGMAEGIVARHLPAYDHFGMNEMHRDVGTAVIAEWRDVAARLPVLNPSAAHAALNLDATYSTRLDAQVLSHRTEISTMLCQLSDECERFYSSSEWVCILGL